MIQIHKAYAVHALTATGAVFAMIALLKAVEGEFSWMFFWLVIALIVDGIDGPLARKYDVKENAPIYDGALLDLIIDYLTYVFIPAFALFYSGFITSWWLSWVVLFTIIFTSGLYFADTRMKTTDYSFQGFPGCWNMVVLVIFATEPAQWIIVSIIVLLAVAQFLPVKFIHPTRTLRWRMLSLPIGILWIIFAAWGALAMFSPPFFVIIGLSLASLYLMSVGIIQQIWFDAETS